MDSYFSISSCAAAATFFTLLGTIVLMFYRKAKFHQENKSIASSSSSSLSLSLSSTPSLSRKHDVFPSFHGADVRKTFLTHILKEFRAKGIDPFIDNNIERTKSIGPELIEAIRGSKIAIVLLSRNYASSSWCLNELVEIMKCREELTRKVVTIFYEVHPTDVKKQTGEFGKVFKKTCKGKTKEEIKRWRKALDGVATIAGEHSRNWDNEAAMIEKIATDVSNMLNNSTTSRDFDGLVGMEVHMERMKLLLSLDLDEVRMIGIWGPSGIGKTTIARCLFNELCSKFQLSVFMENIKELMYTRPVCSDDYSEKLHLQRKFMSQIIKHINIEVPHLGVVQDRLNDKKVLIVLDSVDQLIQLDAIAKETRWFGHGSRIIITTQDKKILKAHGINHIYKVDFPSRYEAFQIFCMYAFGKKIPEDGFEELAWEVTNLLGELPLGLRVMGSYFRGMSEQEWIHALPRLMIRLDASIQSILKFSYDALSDEDKTLFLHIACLFNYQGIEKLEDYMVNDILDVRQGIHVLAEKSLITIQRGRIHMHSLLVKLGQEIVRHEPGYQFILEPGKRQFLCDDRDICQVLTDDTGGRSVIGIKFSPYEEPDEFVVSERSFEKMSNLKFLSVCGEQKFDLQQSFNYLSRKLRLLQWDNLPMICLPSNFCTEHLVELVLKTSKLQKLWEGNRPLGNLKLMDLGYSIDLKELPDLSTAINLRRLLIDECSLVGRLPSSIGNAINLQFLDLTECSNLVELPSSIGNATNLEFLNLSRCTSLVELPSSIGNLHKLLRLNLAECVKLEVLPININLESLDELFLNGCSLLKRFPEISTNIRYLSLRGTSITEVPSSIMSWSRLSYLEFSYSENLKEFSNTLNTITSLYFIDKEIQEIPLWIKKISGLCTLTLRGCKKLVSLPHISDSLSEIVAEDCESLERLDCSFQNPKSRLDFSKCFKLNKEAKELITQTSTEWAVLPGDEVPTCFTHRANTGGSLTIKLNEKALSTSMRFKACIILAKRDNENEGQNQVYFRIIGRNNLGVDVPCKPQYNYLPWASTDHLYIFEFEVDVKFKDLFFDFHVTVGGMVRPIKECGILQL